MPFRPTLLNFDQLPIEIGSAVVVTDHMWNGLNMSKDWSLSYVNRAEHYGFFLRGCQFSSAEVYRGGRTPLLVRNTPNRKRHAGSLAPLARPPAKGLVSAPIGFDGYCGEQSGWFQW